MPRPCRKRSTVWASFWASGLRVQCLGMKAHVRICPPGNLPSLSTNVQTLPLTPSRNVLVCPNVFRPKYPLQVPTRPNPSTYRATCRGSGRVQQICCIEGSVRKNSSRLRWCQCVCRCGSQWGAYLPNFVSQSGALTCPIL